MKANKTLTSLFIVFFTITSISCEESHIELEPVRLELVESENLPSQANLGKVLFYDKKLSFNNSISCASCHKQNLAFADNVSLSVGFENVLTERNSLPIQNVNSFFGFNDLSNNTSFFGGSILFWDGRESSLESMVIQPIQNHIEMGYDDMDELTTKLETIPYYSALFERAYGSSNINTERISRALSSFVNHINANNTKFDKYLRGEETLSSEELEGQRLFVNTYECNECHRVESTNGYLFAGTFANIGLDMNYQDEGRMIVTNNPVDNGQFKIPNLRNIALTSPYMHDGRFETLEDVMDHYSNGVQNNENLDFRLKDENNEPIKPQITQAEKQSIISFLNTLTDHEMISNPKLSNPFN
ncbi:MAG: cytochrome-c peroxidase [Reichenbachiella sp.]